MQEKMKHSRKNKESRKSSVHAGLIGVPMFIKHKKTGLPVKICLLFTIPENRDYAFAFALPVEPHCGQA